NYPIFKFGKIASVPDEAIAMSCIAFSEQVLLRVWLLAINLVPGASGSPVFFDPMFPPGGDITQGEPRGMIIGLQSLSWPYADVAGMTPSEYIIPVISSFAPPDADLTLGHSQKRTAN